VLRTLLPVVGPAVDIKFGQGTIANLGIQPHLDLMKELTAGLADRSDISEPHLEHELLSKHERSGLLLLHTLLHKLDPHHANLGLRRVITPTGDYRWLCDTHYQEWQPKIPECID